MLYQLSYLGRKKSAKKRKEPRNVQPGVGTVNSKFVRIRKILGPDYDAIKTRGQTVSNSENLGQDLFEVHVHFFHPRPNGDHEGRRQTSRVNGGKELHGFPCLTPYWGHGLGEGLCQHRLPAGGDHHLDKSPPGGQRLNPPDAPPDANQTHFAHRHRQGIVSSGLIRRSTIQGGYGRQFAGEPRFRFFEIGMHAILVQNRSSRLASRLRQSGIVGSWEKQRPQVAN